MNLLTLASPLTQRRLENDGNPLYFRDARARSAKSSARAGCQKYWSAFPHATRTLRLSGTCAWAPGASTWASTRRWRRTPLRTRCNVKSLPRRYWVVNLTCG